MTLSGNPPEARVFRVTSSRGLDGEFFLPGDKSISHRSAIIAAIASGRSRISNYSSARDCLNTLECLAALGVPFQIESGAVLIDGVGLTGLQQPEIGLDAGNSGSTMRMLSGVLAGQAFLSSIDGDHSLRQRPMRRIIEPLVKMGARIEARDDNFAPLSIRGGNLKGIEYAPSVASAQVKSSVLLAGLFAKGTTTIVERTPTRNHTEIMLNEYGADLRIEKAVEGTRISIRPGPDLAPLEDYIVAGDISSAAFFLVAALITPDSRIRLRNIGMNPSRTALIDILRSMNGEIQVENSRAAHGEPVVDLAAATSRLSSEVELSGSIIANLIDEAPILSIAATQLEGRLTIRDAGELRHKESDRIRAIVDNLTAMRVEIEEFDDGFSVAGPQRLHGARVSSFGDHRIAMAFAVAGLIAEEETLVDGADAAAVSLPEFSGLLRSSGANIDLQ